MRTTLLAIVLAVSALSGNLQAATARHPSSHRARRGEPAARVARDSTHKVRKGETAARIAQDHGVTVEELRNLNPRVNLARLRPGTALNVRGEMRVAVRPAKPAAGALRAAQTPAAPIAPLPGTPAVGPAPLVHLERILPTEVQNAPPAETAAQDHPGPAAALPASSPTLAGMRRVLPPAAQEAQDSQEDEPDDVVPVPSAQAAVTGFQPADPANLDLLWPVKTRTISSAWGPRIRTRVVRIRIRSRSRRVAKRFMSTHKGVDLSAPMRSDIFAALDAQVLATGKQKGYGNYVALDHGNDVVTFYAHCSSILVQVGEIVRRGQKIAEVGVTGNATGPHVHFELRLGPGGVPQNPLPFMNDMDEVPADMVAANAAAVAP